MNDPSTVKGELIAEFYEAMGFDMATFSSVQRIDIDPGQVRIHVVRVRRNEKGQPFAVGNNIAQETVDVRIDWATYKARPQEPVRNETSEP